VEVGLTGPVKLVVWDLDETLWSGTLSEGPVVLEQFRIDLVRTLNRRGIVNSICSKNEMAAVRQRLEDAGLWDEFVFPSVDWSPKGARVARIIEDAQLRAPDVLFIDDLALNREEARHFAPGIQTADVDIIEGLLAQPELAGKDDNGLSRMHQYRMLEHKLADRRSTPDSNETFLRSCDIRVAIGDDVMGEADRLFELVNRTNQLNFTKCRPSRAEFDSMLADPDCESRYVKVRDRYGDYGICGFYSRSPGPGPLTDFLFSCRVLNMGVEQWLYDYLGRPKLQVVGEVASTLDTPVDWISLEAEAGDVVAPAAPASGSDGMMSGRRILIVGGCDLLATAQFLGGDVATDFHRTSDTGAPVHAEHTEILRQSLAGLTPAQKAVVDSLPYIDERAFAPPSVVAPEYDVLVYSLLVDYSQGMYRHRTSGLIAPLCQYSRVVTDPDNWPGLEADLGNGGIDRAFLEWFADEFEYLGYLPVDQFQENIRLLARSIPAHAQLILLNGAEIAVDNPKEPDRHLRHIEMNAALDEIIDSLPNTTLCDVRLIVATEDDVFGNIRHYRRSCYLRMAEEIRAAGASGLKIRRDSAVRRGFVPVRRVVGPLRAQLRQKLGRSPRVAPGSAAEPPLASSSEGVSR
jgi:FkbH-like protein